MITTNDIGKQFIDTQVDEVVTLIALDQWPRWLAACVCNPNTPNPSNIPGIDHYWLDSRHLQPVEGN